jgi:1-phosphatidylinositol-4-phosphate 5-kinase
MKISCVDPVTYGHRFLNFLVSVMRGGDLSLRPAGLEAKDCAQRAVGDRGQDQPNAEESAKATGIAAGRLNQEKGHHGTPIPGTPIAEPETLADYDAEAAASAVADENPVARSAIVGHTKAD